MKLRIKLAILSAISHLFLSAFVFSNTAHANDGQELKLPFIPYGKTPTGIFSKRTYESGQAYVDIDVTSSKKNKQDYQSLSLYMVALHPLKCSLAVKRLGQYEKYANYLPFLDYSHYAPKTKRFQLLIRVGQKNDPQKNSDSSKWSYAFTLDFKINRLEDPKKTFSITPFQFDEGFLKGLKGSIYIRPHHKKCHIETQVRFEGPHTNIPNFLLEVIGNFVVTHGIKNLFYKTSF